MGIHFRGCRVLAEQSTSPDSKILPELTFNHLETMESAEKAAVRLAKVGDRKRSKITQPILRQSFLLWWLLNLSYYNFIMYSLTCIFGECFRTHFYKLKATTFIGVLSGNTNLICPNYYLFCSLCSHTLNCLPPLLFPISFSFVIRQNAVVSILCWFR